MDTQARDEIDALKAENERLRDALLKLISETERHYAPHLGDAREEARAALRQSIPVSDTGRDR